MCIRVRRQSNSRSARSHRLTYSPEMAVIHRVNQYRAITVAALPAPGHLADGGHRAVDAAIREFEQQLPAGYRFEIVGELKEQLRGRSSRWRSCSRQ